MIVRRFLAWIETASAGRRAEGVSALARAYLYSEMAADERADAMIVFGSSLMVYSGYRFCERASSSGKPIVPAATGSSP